MGNNWTVDKVRKVMETHTNPSTLDGFIRKDYCGKGRADLKVAEGAREFVAKITTNVRDREDEVVDPKGIDFISYLKNPIILWGHDYDQPAIGRSLWIKTLSENRKPVGHISKGIVAEGVTKAEEIFKLMQQRILGTVSIGFIPVKSHEPTEDDLKANSSYAGVRRIHDEIVMLEYSIVNVPANPDATIDAVSKGILTISAPLQQDLGLYVPPNAIDFVKKATLYAQTPQDGIEAGWILNEELRSATIDDLAKMAAWIDSDSPELQQSYKFIHHRSSAGNPLVWLGLNQAMAKLNTFVPRIPDEDRKDVYRHLAKHYEDFGKAAPVLVSKPEKFSLATIPIMKIKAQEPVTARPGIKYREVPVAEIPQVTSESISPDHVAQLVKDHIDINILGRV